MNAPASTRAKLETLIALARLLERIDSEPSRIGPSQYQGLVRQLKTSLDDDLPQRALQAVLAAHPATAELYENLHYEHAGLSRSPLERAVASEMLAAQTLARFTLAKR